MTTGWTDIAAKGWVRIRVDGHDTIVPPDAGGHFTATVLAIVSQNRDALRATLEDDR